MADVSLKFEPNDFIQARRGGYRINPDGMEAAELRKHEQFPTYFTGPQGPGNPYRYRPFPKMLYRAELTESGKVACMLPEPSPLEFRMAMDPPSAHRQATEAVNNFNTRCQKVVNDEAEMSRACEDGWRQSPKEAEEYLHSRFRKDGDAAAERAYADRNMSEKAKAEAAAFEQADGPFHQPEIKEQPVKRRKPWTPEQKAAAAERMKVARAAKAAKKE